MSFALVRPRGNLRPGQNPSLQFTVLCNPGALGAQLLDQPKSRTYAQPLSVACVSAA